MTSLGIPLDERGPRSVLALLALILGVIPVTALIGLVLSIVAFFRISASQHRAQLQLAVGFGVGAAWVLLLAGAACMLFIH